MKTSLKIIATLLFSAGVNASADPLSLQSTDQNILAMNTTVLSPFWQSVVQKGHIVGKDGVQLAYSYVIPEQPKETFLLLQGRTESMMKYHELIWQLHMQGYAVFTLDHRGQGLSARMLENPQKGHVDKFQDYVDDQLLFIDTVVKKQPTTGPLLLLTHSMGGAVGSLLMAQQPTLFKAAVLSSPMHMPNTELLFSEADGCYVASTVGWMCSDCYAGFVDVPYNATAFADNVLTQSAERYQLFRETYKAQPQLQLGGPTWQWLTESCAVADDMADTAKAVQTPFIILQGSADTVVSNSAQDQFCDNAATACQGVVKIVGGRHELFIEQDQYRQPAIAALLAFFAKATQN